MCLRPLRESFSSVKLAHPFLMNFRLLKSPFHTYNVESCCRDSQITKEAVQVNHCSDTQPYSVHHVCEEKEATDTEDAPIFYV